MRRKRFVKGKRYVEIAYEYRIVDTFRGEVGGKERGSRRRFQTVAEAETARERLFSNLLKQGFVLAGPAARTAAAAPAPRPASRARGKVDPLDVAARVQRMPEGKYTPETVPAWTRTQLALASKAAGAKLPEDLVAVLTSGALPRKIFRGDYDFFPAKELLKAGGSFADLSGRTMFANGCVPIGSNSRRRGYYCAKLTDAPIRYFSDQLDAEAGSVVFWPGEMGKWKLRVEAKSLTSWLARVLPD